MNITNHITDKPFVLATGLAALIHSTWSLGTLFSGEQPPVEDIETLIQFVHFIGWLLPALLMAIALDVGQIVTSHEIRTSGLTWQRGLTFFVFGFATYYLQWLYIAMHMPALDLADGVSVVYSGFAVIMRDSAMWLIPALLPLSTILYTFSGHEGDKQKSDENESSFAIEIVQPESVELVADDSMNLLIAESENDELTAHCYDCGWSKNGYETRANADKGLRLHQSRHCKAKSEVLQEAIEVLADV